MGTEDEEKGGLKLGRCPCSNPFNMGVSPLRLERDASSQPSCPMGARTSELTGAIADDRTTLSLTIWLNCRFHDRWLG